MYIERYLSHLYSKLTIIIGDNYLTIENANNLTPQEIRQFIPHFINHPSYKHINSIKLLLDKSLGNELDSFLHLHDFQMIDKLVRVERGLNCQGCSVNDSPYVYKNLKELSIQEFKHLWNLSMAGSPNAQSSLNIDEHIQSVISELGENYDLSCMAVYEKEKPIGVIIPHIEPGTEDEGRLFYFGLIQSERGKGKSRIIHQDAHYMLYKDFKATYYIGSTSYNNQPMIRTFIKNGCRVKEELLCYSLTR